MKRILTSILTAVLLVTAGGLTTGAAASEQSPSPERIAGYTKSEFVTAASKLGVSPAMASTSWGNTDLMARIPISGATSGGRETNTKTMVATLATASYSGTCTNTWTNIFGGVLAQFRVYKSWTADGATIQSATTTIGTSEGWGWSFNGINISQDYYIYAYENYRGIHVADRQGRWTWGSDGDATNLFVKFESLLSGNYRCS